MEHNLEEYLEAELASETKRRDLTLYVVLPLTLFSAVMFTWVCGRFRREVLSPESVAMVAAYHIDAGLPQWIDTMETHAIESSPGVIERGKLSLQNSLPYISGGARNFIDEMVGVMPQFTRATVDVVNLYFSTHQADVAAMMAKQGPTGVTSSLVHSLVTDALNAPFGESGVPIAARFEDSRVALRGINQQLGELASPRPLEMGHIQRQQRRAIGALTRFLTEFTGLDLSGLSQ
jgi:hypothetical protein